tara:strand:- start:356 stop:1255 length:900 start_codon:yes stop_codon:yes gene_type:complete
LKKLEVFSFTGKMVLNEEVLNQETYQPNLELSREQDIKVDFIPLFEDTLIQQVNRFTMAKLFLQSRKEPDKKLLEKVTLSRLGNDHTEEEYVAKECDVRRELIQYTGVKETNILVVIDNETGKLILSNLDTQTDIADDVIGTLRDYVSGYEDLELIKFQAPIIEKFLTNVLLDESKNLPDPFMLVDKAELGVKSEFDKSPKGSTVKVEKEYPSDAETVSFITNRNLVVKALKLDYDGVIEFLINMKSEVKSIKFTEALAFKPDEDSSDSVNFMTQYELQLPSIFSMINKITKTLSEVEY